MQETIEAGRESRIKGLRNKAAELERKGANVTLIKKLLMAANCGSERLLSIDSELSSLELLDNIHDIKDFSYEDPGDLTFPGEQISYSVKTVTLGTETHKRIYGTADYFEKIYGKEGYLVQIIMGDEIFSGNRPVITEERINEGQIKSVTEIEISLIPFQGETNEIILKRVKKGERNFKKEGYNGTRIVIVDLRHIPHDFSAIINFLKEKIEQIKIDGVLLLVYDINIENRFFFVGQSNSNRLDGTYKKVITGSPISAEWFYTVPIRIKTEKQSDWYNAFQREEDGTLVINGKKVCKSLAADEQILITGVRGNPEKIKSLTFEY